MKFWYSCFPLIICVISINFQCNGDEIKTPFDLHVQQGTKVSLDESITGSLFGFSLALKDMTLFVGAPKYDEGKGGAFYCDLKDCKKYVECSCEAINSINERGIYGSMLGGTLEASNEKVVVCAPRYATNYSYTPKQGNGICYDFSTQNDDSLSNATVQEVFQSLYNERISKCNPDYPSASCGFTYNQTNVNKGGSASLGYGIVVSEDSMVIGTPMFNKIQYHKIGGTIKITQHDSKDTFTKFNSKLNELRNKLKVRTQNKKTKTYQESENFDIPNSYLGWSVIKGNVREKDAKDDYAIGAPNANGMQGSVYVCPDCFDETDKETIEVKGFQLGERFGHSICFVDINGDGFDDLVVGAPLHSKKTDTFSEGAVYVFGNTGKEFETKFALKATSEILDKYDTAILSRWTGPGHSRYGYSMVNLGTLNDDKFEDFAVGAPFEGDGAVYIYFGNARFWSDNAGGFDTVKFKKVTPTSLKMNSMSGFGYSFSNAVHNAGKENGVPYVAVGAVNITGDDSEDATAVLLTSALICIGIKSECKSEGFLSQRILKPFREMNGKSPAFNASFIPPRDISTLGGDKITKIIGQIDFHHLDKRLAYHEQNQKYSLMLTRDGEGWQYSNLTIPFDIKYNDFDPNLQIVDPLLLNEATISWKCEGIACIEDDILAVEKINFPGVNFASECSDRGCNCSLKSSYFYNNGLVKNSKLETEISQKRVDLIIRVENIGTEPFYPMQSHNQKRTEAAGYMTINSDVALDHHRASGRCKNESGDYKCDLDVIPIGHYQEFLIPIDILQSLHQNLFGESAVHKLRTTLSTNCLQRGQENSELDFKFTFNYHITAKTISEEREYIMRSKTSTKFTHVYEIEGGPAPTNVLELFFLYVPKILNTSLSDIKIQPEGITNNCTLIINSDTVGSRKYERFTQEGHPSFCESFGSKHEKCVVFQCELKPGFGVVDAKTLRVTIDLNFASDERDGFSGGKTTMSTALKVKGSPNFQMARTTFVYQEFTVGNILEYWPIGVGIVISLVILIAICYIMYKKNLFGKLRFARNVMESKENEEEKEQQKNDEQQEPMLK